MTGIFPAARVCLAATRLGVILAAAACLCVFPHAARAQNRPPTDDICKPIIIKPKLIDGLCDPVATLSPFLTVRANSLMALDPGLDHQIDLFGSESDGDNQPGKPSGLGGPVGSSFMDGWRGGAGSLLGPSGEPIAPLSLSFAASLQQMRKAGAAPYALGATPRAAAPAISRFDLWAQGYIARFEDDAGQSKGEGETGVLYIGADYRLSSEIVVGALVQFDDTQEDFDLLPSTAGSTGWMAGPHATVRLSENVFAQVRAAWGGSDNEIRSVAGEDHFDTDRWLVRGTLLGQWQSGPWQLRPRASVGYIEEDQESYEDTFGAIVPGQTVSLGQAKAGSQIAYRHRMADGTLIEPGVLLEGIWNFHQDAEIILDDLASGDDVRGRVEAGLMIVTVDGMALGGSVVYDGIGSGDYHAIGGVARIKVPMN